MHVLLIFIDGFGIGEPNEAINPLVRYPGTFFPRQFGQPLTRQLGKVVGDVCLVPTDATLGVAGLPQSATGQTTIFTGVNAAKAVGHHVQAFPGPQLAKLIREHGIIGQVKKLGYRATSANMYTPNYLDLVARRKRRHSVTTLVILEGGESLRSVPEMENGQAVYQDIINKMLPEFGITSVAGVSPAKAAERLVGIASQHHFTMFEYFQTDRCGHKQDWLKAAEIIGVLDEFITAIFRSIPSDMLVIVTSDHGNFEDFSVKTHTANPVPTMLFGCQAQATAAAITDLTNITPAIVSALERNEIK